MHILYVIHAFPWNETTGATLVLDNYVKQAALRNISVSIMVPDSAYKHTEHTLYGSTVSLYRFGSQDNWGVSAFDNVLLNSGSVATNLNFVPDLVHIIDWVGFHPTIFPYFKNMGCPIIRSVCNFEEFCPFASPVYYDDGAMPCKSPLNSKQCLECVLDNIQLFVPAATYKYKELIRALDNYRNNYRQEVTHLIYGRDCFVRNLYKNYVDYAVFPSEGFGRYFLSQLQQDLNYKVIQHGLSDAMTGPMRESTQPIKIIYTGGDRVNKGWNIMAGTLEILQKEPNDKYEIYCVGNANAIPDQYFQHLNIKLFRHPAYQRDEEVNVLRSFDVAIAPSHFESYGLFVRECVRSRVIPIVIPSLGVSEFIVDGENGFVLDQPFSENLARLILGLTVDPKALTSLRAGLDSSSVPTASEEFSELLNIYNQLVGNHPTG